MPSRVHDAFWKRALLSLPFVPLFIWPSVDEEASAALMVPYLLKMVEDGFWSSSNGEITLSMDERHLHMPWLDKAMNPLIAVFSPSMTGIDPVGRLQMISFLADMAPLFVVGVLEKSRRHHHWSALIYPILFAVASQILGIGKLAGAHFLVEYFWSPSTKLATAESALIPRRAVNSLFAAMLLVYYPLLAACYFAPAVEARIQANAVWQLFPILVPLVQAVFFRLGGDTNGKSASPAADTTRVEDIRSVRLAIGTLCTLSTLTFLYVRFSRPQDTSMLEIFLPFDYGTPMDSLETAARRFLQWDHIGWIAPAYYWLLLSFRDLALRGGVEIPWVQVLLALGLGTVSFGAGATFGLVWLWRESMLSRSFGGVKRD
ncbi:hypothetical protein BJY01DRAFT_254808 [Aspergillus pseudoustus]|uniref:Uncharacterized protein n=1 Tax=Aspergillus pseudoustus TaxID=1810923 RepID=A0ABR4IQE4_9EURO